MYKNTLKYFWLVTSVLYSLSYLEIVQISKDDVLFTLKNCCSVAKSCLILCNPSSVLHCLLEFAQIHVHCRVGNGTTHSSTLAWKIPWMEEPGRLQSMGSWRVGHNWVTSLSLLTFMHWRRKWQPTPVFLPGESQKQRSLVGCCLWGHTESDTTEAT